MTDANATYINPLTDFGFKYLFGREGNKDFIISFLNSLIKDGSPITSVEFLDKENTGEAKDNRENTLERWIYLMKNMEKMEAMPNTFMKDPVFRRLDEVARIGSLNERERKAYRQALKVYRDNYAIAETEREEGRAEGRASLPDSAAAVLLCSCRNLGLWR